MGLFPKRKRAAVALTFTKASEEIKNAYADHKSKNRQIIMPINILRKMQGITFRNNRIYIDLLRVGSENAEYFSLLFGLIKSEKQVARELKERTTVIKQLHALGLNVAALYYPQAGSKEEYKKQIGTNAKLVKSNAPLIKIMPNKKG